MTKTEWKAVAQLSENLKHNEILHIHLQERYEATLADMKKQRSINVILIATLIFSMILNLLN